MDEKKESKPLNLQKIRVEKGHTLRSLASEIGVHYSLISYWEYGKKKPRSANLMRLEKALNTPGKELFKELEEDDGK
ncbi:helix-turn-helix transcriptional regulator [Staphylococcus phage JD007]|uniref:HTH cro/C1-type domain-containing protein n=3 Tax=Kayvirus TaxID=1857843 RepID=V5XVT9_BPS25|nr:helix-turn-helix transcriptional regulator [Staphylococcus phage JD007]YP_008854195.1 helix-turn-helix transcriptional regulator [Staphylococcus phage S25-3]YP_009006717.1 helix-turn-helix transcriptional regulator [Staphylococcus phage phiSA12]AUV57065.1 transcriptional regulator [Staphylococcus phage vB_SauM_LM12]QEM41319.1 transcriptional regulator [Staphylococcus phage Maine]QKV30611.1 putative transcriptional regulator [Staphylococcus phage ESa1]WBF81942.1 helix-turn-helix transcripti